MKTSMRDARLFDEPIPRLRRYARALTGNRAQADDLIQECLARAWERLSLWRRACDLRAGWFAMLRHVLVNEPHRAKTPAGIAGFQ